MVRNYIFIVYELHFYSIASSFLRICITYILSEIMYSSSKNCIIMVFNNLLPFKMYWIILCITKCFHVAINSLCKYFIIIIHSIFSHNQTI